MTSLTNFLSRERHALWLLWITPALWSVNYIVARTAPGVIEPHMLALGRWALAGFILSVIARSELWRERRSTWRAAWQYLVLGALGMLVCGAWVYKGAQRPPGFAERPIACCRHPCCPGAGCRSD